MTEKEIFLYVEEELTEIVGAAFADSGYAVQYGAVKKADRPDLGDYQCNGAFQAAREYKKAPALIAREVCAGIRREDVFAGITVAGNGFINFTLNTDYILKRVEMIADYQKYRFTREPRQVILDYGGPNIAKPLHVGHLRSAIIGDALKRILAFAGDRVLADVHLGDWGLQMGMVILGILQRKEKLAGIEDEAVVPDLTSLDITLDDLNEIYPRVSAQCKEDKEMLARAQKITALLQSHHKGYYALWQYITEKSMADLKRNYAQLNITFDLWLGESSVNDVIPGMVEELKTGGFACPSEGALIIDISLPDDTMEIPPFMLLTSNASALYSTTDLATLKYRMLHFSPGAVIYVTDKRQEMHFEQVFRAARKTGIVPESTSLQHIGFGTMNGEDGKPFKTRAGGVMRLSDLISQVLEKAGEKIREQNPNEFKEEALLQELAAKIGIAALKYADLINTPAKDYVFNLDKFCSFEGKTGAYLLYANTRIKAIFRKVDYDKNKPLALRAPASDSERAILLTLLDFPARLQLAYKNLQPNVIAEYCYQLANAFNSFYKVHHIKSEKDRGQKESWLRLAQITSRILELGIDLLGMEPVDYM